MGPSLPWTIPAPEQPPIQPKRIHIIRRGLLAQKWYAKFIATNGLTLARTTEHYHNLGDLKAMLTKYYPDWPVTVISRDKP